MLYRNRIKGLKNKLKMKILKNYGKKRCKNSNELNPLKVYLMKEPNGEKV